jgi:hypothetical protein
VFTPDGLAVWAAGDSSAIYLSTDAGVSYQRLTVGPLPLYGIASTGFTALAVGAGGRVYRSTNFGGTWSTQDLAGVSRPSRDLGFGVQDRLCRGFIGTIRRITDGVTWCPDLRGRDHAPVRFSMPRLGGGRWRYRATNGGANWIPLVPTSNLLAIGAEAPESGSGRLGTCLKSGDSGASWSHVNLKLDVRSTCVPCAWFRPATSTSRVAVLVLYRQRRRQLDVQRH